MNQDWGFGPTSRTCVTKRAVWNPVRPGAVNETKITRIDPRPTTTKRGRQSHLPTERIKYNSILSKTLYGVRYLPDERVST